MSKYIIFEVINVKNLNLHTFTMSFILFLFNINVCKNYNIGYASIEKLIFFWCCKLCQAHLWQLIGASRLNPTFPHKSSLLQNFTQFSVDVKILYPVLKLLFWIMTNVRAYDDSWCFACDTDYSYTDLYPLNSKELLTAGMIRITFRILPK